tara:strand:- start:846 stop:1211 length:366 start_codon:yes stop_codon:yes gene_type:complete
MTDLTDLWNTDKPVADYCWGESPLPSWIEQDITCYTVAAIVQGGCASGAYMPAVTYHQASETMSEHGDAVLDYLSEHDAMLPPPEEASWSGLAVHYLSSAVEVWASIIQEPLTRAVKMRRA